MMNNEATPLNLKTLNPEALKTGAFCLRVLQMPTVGVLLAVANRQTAPYSPGKPEGCQVLGLRGCGR